MHTLSLTLFFLLLRPSLTLDCSIAPPFRGLKSRPKATGLRIGRNASILFTPPFNASLVEVRFGMQAKESSLLFEVKLKKSKMKYYLPTNQNLAIFVHHLIVYQKCTRPFFELVIIPRCSFSKKIYFIPNSGDEIQYEVISYEIMNPTIYKSGKTLVLSTEIIECRAIDLRTRGYFISHSFPVFYFPNKFVRVPARIVSEINKTQVIYVITYRISNETILDNNVIPSAITIAYETSQRAFGVHVELSQIAHTLGISWMPSGQLQQKGNLLRFRYTFLRNESHGLTALEVHLGRQKTLKAGQQSLLMRVTPLPRGETHTWQGFRLPSEHLAFHALHHMTSSAEGDLQTLEVGLIPDESCRVPMIFHVLAMSAKGRQWRYASAYFESFSLRSFDLWRRPRKQEGDVRMKVGFCSPHLIDRAPPKIRWRLEGLYSNWTTLATQSQQQDEYSLLLSTTFSVLLRCEVQNLSLSVAYSKAFQVVLDEVLPDDFCEANVGWSVVTAHGEHLQDLTWIRKHEPFFIRLHAHIPQFFSVDALMQVNISRQQPMTFHRSRFEPDGEVLRLQQQWRQYLNDCHLYADTLQAQIVDSGQTMAVAKMAILPQFCQPRITEFKVLSQSSNGAQLAISCRIETSPPLYDAFWGILDNGKSVKDLVLKRKGTILMVGAAINFSSCEDLQLRVVVCWFRQRNMHIVSRPLSAQGAFCEGPMLYFLFLVCGVLPIIGFLYLIIVLRGCLLKRKQRI